MKIFSRYAIFLIGLWTWNCFASDAEPLRDIAYGPDKHQIMDVYSSPHAHAAPVILMVHGGGWQRGDKTNKGVVENKVARWLPKGFIFISIDYRMLPQLNGLQQADDAAAALAFAQAHAASWGGDPSKFILMGHSAGAHLVALLTAAPSKAYALGAKPWLGTVALDSAAYDIPAIMQRKHIALYDQAFGSDRTTWEQASPLYVLARNAVPLLAVCSIPRPDKPCDQAHAFAAKAKTLGASVIIVEENLSHMEINQQLGLAGAYTDAVEDFIATLNPQLQSMLHGQPAHR